MSALDNKIPPVVIALAAIALSLILAWALPGLDYDFPDRWVVGTIVFLSGAAMAVAGVRKFRSVGTTVDPQKIEKATFLVTDGPYRYSRNPMYLGVTIALVGVAFLIGDLLAFAGPIFFLLYINYFQIIPEERAAAANFGRPYLDYKRRTRRWI